jgi:hypothetical protein
MDERTIQSISNRAVALGKQFNPNPEIADRLQSDLNDPNTLVLFTQNEVIEAADGKKFPEKWRLGLLDLVNPDGTNDIAVIPGSALEAWKKQV